MPRERFREAAVEFLDETVDELGLESFALAGGSMGGTWAPGRPASSLEAKDPAQ